MNRDLARVDEHARRMGALAAPVVELPGFTLFVPEGAAWAVPDRPADDADGLDAQLATLFAAFAERGQPVRVELVSLAWPGLAAALASRGLASVEETPLVVRRPGGLPPARPPSSARVRWVEPSDDLAFVGSLMRQGFELRGAAPGAVLADELRAALAGPLRIAVAELDGLPAGSGCAATVAGICEISSVSTLPNQRRRGVGSALVTFLADEHLRAGGELSWACVPDTRAAGLFYDAGFEDGGLRVCLA